MSRKWYEMVYVPGSAPTAADVNTAVEIHATTAVISPKCLTHESGIATSGLGRLSAVKQESVPAFLRDVIISR
jgi:hypothetical protein